MKTKRFKIIALICAALFTVTLAIGILFACLPEQREEATVTAVPMADTTITSAWENSDTVEYTNMIIIGIIGDDIMPVQYRATSASIFFEASGLMLTDDVYQTYNVCQLVRFEIMSVSEMQSEGYDPSRDCPICVHWRDSNGQVNFQPLFDCTDFVFIFNFDSVPYCFVSFFEYISNVDSGTSSSYDEGYNDGYDQGVSDGDGSGSEAGYKRGFAEGQTVGYNRGLTEGDTAGYNRGHQVGYDEGYEEGHTAGYNEGIAASEGDYNTGYSAGYSYGQDVGYNNGLDAGIEQGRTEGYNEGYSDGYNKGSSGDFVNPIMLFIDPVHKFMNTPFFGDLTYSAIFNVILFVAVATIFIKMFGSA